MQRVELYPHLSYSQAACANRCPRQWALKYSMDVSTPASPAMEHGKAVDDAVSAYLTAKFGLTPQVYGDHIYPYEVGRDAAAVLAHMADWEVVGVQTRHEGAIRGVGWPVVGYSDFILRDGTIVDLKCSRQWRDDWTTQVSLYHLIHPRENVPWTLWGPPYMCRVLRVYNGKVTEYNFEADEKAAAQYVRDAWAVTQGPRHPATPGQQCSWCSVQEECQVLCAMEATVNPFRLQPGEGVSTLGNDEWGRQIGAREVGRNG